MKKKRIICNYPHTFFLIFIAYTIYMNFLVPERSLSTMIDPVVIFNIFYQDPWKLLVIAPLLSYGFMYFEVTDTEMTVRMFPFLKFETIRFEDVVEAGVFKCGTYDQGLKRMYFAFRQLTDTEIYRMKNPGRTQRNVLSPKVSRVYDFNKRLYKYLTEEIGIEFIKLTHIPKP